MARRSSWAVVLVCVASAGCGEPRTSDHEESWGQGSFGVKVCPKGEVLEGIDVSYYQGKPDWTKVAESGLHFAVTRVNHGGFMDPEFDTNWAAIKEVGLVRSAYQYFNPGDDPIEQADVLIGKVGQLGPGDLPAVIDVESTDGMSATIIAANVQTWVDRVEEGTGRKPIIYTGSYFWNDNVETDALNDHPLWIAHYGTNCPNLPDAWTDWAIWQYSSTGSVPGISGNVDTDRFNGPEVELQDLAANGYRASVVSVDYPHSLGAGQVGTVTLVMRNDGARSWDGDTRLGTTEPRDRASPFAAASWESDNRAAAVVAPVAHGEEATLTFAVLAPASAGSYVEHFNLVQQGVAWFSDTPPGGGPADDAIALAIEVLPPGSDPGDGGGGEGAGGGTGTGGGGGELTVVGIPARQSDSSCRIATTAARGDGAARWWASLVALALVSRLRRSR